MLEKISEMLGKYLGRGSSDGDADSEYGPLIDSLSQKFRVRRSKIEISKFDSVEGAYRALESVSDLYFEHLEDILEHGDGFNCVAKIGKMYYLVRTDDGFNEASVVREVEELKAESKRNLEGLV